MNAELIQSLLASPEKAKRHIRFFQYISYITTIPFMIFSFVAIFLGVGLFTNNAYILGLFLFLLGVSSLSMFAKVFIRLDKAVKATVFIAKKYNLI